MTMLLSNDFEPLHSSNGQAKWIVVGQDDEGLWYMGPGDRKTGAWGAAVRFTSQEAAQRHATRMGGQVWDHEAPDCPGRP